MSGARSPGAPAADVGLARQQTIRELVAVYHEQVRRVRQAYATLDDVQRVLSVNFAEDDRTIYVGRASYGWRDWSHPDHDIEGIAAQVWTRLVDKLEVKRFLSVAKAAELEQQIERRQMPPITYENVIGLMMTFEQNGQGFAEEAVREVFERLRVRNSRLKTNTEFELGAKVILPWMVEWWPHARQFRVEYRAQQEFRALENVFQLLDEKAARNRDHYSQLQQAIEASGESGRGATEYFEFRCFANRNLHLKFLRPDLVDRLNKVAGGKRLRKASS